MEHILLHSFSYISTVNTLRKHKYCVSRGTQLIFQYFSGLCEKAQYKNTQKQVKMQQNPKHEQQASVSTTDCQHDEPRTHFSNFSTKSNKLPKYMCFTSFLPRTAETKRPDCQQLFFPLPPLSAQHGGAPGRRSRSTLPPTRLPVHPTAEAHRSQSVHMRTRYQGHFPE